MTQAVIFLFEELVRIAPPKDAPMHFDTACVIGGSIAGLMAARVLSDHARRVVIIEPDDIPADTAPRPGVPHGRHVHTLQPAGQQWVERWLPGITWEAQEYGALLAASDKLVVTFNGVRRAAEGGGHHTLVLGRPLLENLIRKRVVSLSNVSVLRGRGTGLHYRDGAVSAVTYVATNAEDQGGNSTRVLEADFVVDAMGRSSRLSHWLGRSGYDQPRIERLEAPINYATTVFERPENSADLEAVATVEFFAPDYPSDGVSIAAATAIEDQQWLVGFSGYGDNRPGRTIDALREACTRLNPVFATATAHAAIGDVATYRQAESRRRQFTEVSHFPARLVSVGDAVASFNPAYGQGMSSAALHASCLASYLAGNPDLGSAAREFFRLQEAVVDAAWTISAEGDAARLDAQNGTEVPDDVRRKRWAAEQITAAALVDQDISTAFTNVGFMLRHPATLSDPALLERAAAVNERAAAE
ncbi:FAD-dependent oxidoreductase [Streptomyces sp. NPDC056663]|uniref:FAD-dependent oxidoreductase n=1 Tax=Streptomyces sp. NPDC056663 TaxID=3345899 RepID=UPI00368044D5